MRGDCGVSGLPSHCGVSQPPWFGSFQIDQWSTRGSGGVFTVVGGRTRRGGRVARSRFSLLVIARQEGQDRRLLMLVLVTARVAAADRRHKLVELVGARIPGVFDVAAPVRRRA